MRTKSLLQPHKNHLADTSVGPSVILNGKTLLEGSTALGLAAEAAFFNYLYTGFHKHHTSFRCWNGKNMKDFGQISRQRHELRNSDGNLAIMPVKGGKRGYVVTKYIFIFGVLPLAGEYLMLLKIPLIGVLLVWRPGGWELPAR